MTAIRVSLLTIESDSADPALLITIRGLLERAGVSSVLVAASTPVPETATPSPNSAAVELGRRGGIKGGRARAEALSDEERSEAARYAANKRWASSEPVAAAESPPERAPCVASPPCSGCRAGGVCSGIAEGNEPPAVPPPPVIWEPPAVPPRTLGTPGTRRVEQSIADLVEREAKPEPAPVIDLSARCLKAILAQSGTSVPALANMLLGGATQDKLRQIEMALNPLVLTDQIYRSTGRLFPSVKNAVAPAPAASSGPMLRHGTPGRPAPLNEVQLKKDAYNAIVAAFTKDNAYPIAQLATDVFGDDTGKSTRKIKLMLLQLKATERLEQLGADQWRPLGKDAKPGRGLDGDEGDEDEDETESNGQPDENDDLEELDVG